MILSASVFAFGAFQAASGTIELAIRHRRPSAMVAGLRGLAAKLEPHDDRGTVGISGSLGDVERARQVLRLSDVPRKPILLRVTVESPADHLTWEVDVRLATGQRWRTADDETGAEVALEPRVDADGTLVVRVLARCGKDETTSLLRLAKGRSATFPIGTRVVQSVTLSPEAAPKVSEVGIPLPKVTVRYVGG